jgi:hypothetical protein
MAARHQPDQQQIHRPFVAKKDRLDIVFKPLNDRIRHASPDVAEGSTVSLPPL